MGVVERPVVFRRGSNVLEYWLAHAEGFEVASGTGRRARVESVYVDPVRGHATGLVVRSSGVGRSHRRLLAADTVVAVDPFLRTLHLARPSTEQPPAGMRAASLVVAAADRSRRTLAPLPPAVSAGARAGYAWSAPRLRQASSTAARFGLKLGVSIGIAGAWLGPRVRALAGAGWVALLGLGGAAVDAGRRVYARLADDAPPTPSGDDS
jgi:hypothetical protein